MVEPFPGPGGVGQVCLGHALPMFSDVFWTGGGDAELIAHESQRRGGDSAFEFAAAASWQCGGVF